LVWSDACIVLDKRVFGIDTTPVDVPVHIANALPAIANFNVEVTISWITGQ